jgi:hypothetical protein
MRSVPLLIVATAASLALPGLARADGEHKPRVEAPVVRKAIVRHVVRHRPRIVHRRVHVVAYPAPGEVIYRGAAHYNAPAGMVVNYASDGVVTPYLRERVYVYARPIDPPGVARETAVLTPGYPTRRLMRLER